MVYCAGSAPSCFINSYICILWFIQNTVNIFINIFQSIYKHICFQSTYALENVSLYIHNTSFTILKCNLKKHLCLALHIISLTIKTTKLSKYFAGNNQMNEEINKIFLMHCSSVKLHLHFIYIQNIVTVAWEIKCVVVIESQIILYNCIVFIVSYNLLPALHFGSRESSQ